MYGWLCRKLAAKVDACLMHHTRIYALSTDADACINVSYPYLYTINKKQMHVLMYHTRIYTLSTKADACLMHIIPIFIHYQQKRMHV
jgi:hypothetical protein